jgi:Mn-containing catalase
MDVEGTIEFLLERQSAHQARADAEMTEIRAVVREIAESQKETDRQAARTEAALRRAIRLSVEEHRRERVRRQRLDDSMANLALAQARTEETLFIDSLKQPRNGHDKV